MKKFLFTITIIVLFVLVGCAPDGVYKIHGDKLDDKIKSDRITAAVLPTVDWSERESCFYGYTIYGLGAVFGINKAYDNAGMLVTNEIKRSLWKKNAMHLTTQTEILESMRMNNFSKEEIFPSHEYQVCSRMPKPISTTNSVGQGAPDYEKLYGLGEELDVDIIFISRITKNSETNVLPQMSSIGSPIIPGLGAVVSLAQYGYRAGIKGIKSNYVAIDIMALDVRDREVIAFGGYNMINEIPAGDKNEALQEYTNALTFYAPMPEDEDLQREFYAEAGSQAATFLANYLLHYVTGLSIAMRFDFEYVFADETWKMYPENYFDDNFSWSAREYNRLFY